MRLLPIGLLSLLLCACVTQGKYDKAVADAATLRGALQRATDETAKREAADRDARAKVPSSTGGLVP